MFGRRRRLEARRRRSHSVAALADRASSWRSRWSYGSNSATSPARKRLSAAMQRVRACAASFATRCRVDVEREIDRVVAVGDLENHPRLEVLRAPIALAPRSRRPLAESRERCVLDVRVDERTAVEAGQVENVRSLSRARYGIAHVTLLSWSSRGRRPASSRSTLRCGGSDQAAGRGRRTLG